MMFSKTKDALGIMTSVQRFYEAWVEEVRAEDEAMAVSLPAWKDLTYNQQVDWMSAYAATIEVGNRMARAVVGVMEGRADAR